MIVHHRHPVLAGDWDDRPLGRDFLQLALQYREWGWRLIPLDEKKPLVPWGHIPTVRYTDRFVGRLFDPVFVRPTGIGLITGPSSGRVYVRDFDTVAGYHR